MRTDTAPIPVIEVLPVCAWCKQEVKRAVTFAGRAYHQFTGEIDCVRAAIHAAAIGGLR